MSRDISPNKGEDELNMAFLIWLKNHRIPQLLELKDFVSKGQKLFDSDLLFLQQALADARQNITMVERHPEFKELVGKVFSLYDEITKLALENENI